jgi:hypothetical protein
MVLDDRFGRLATLATGLQWKPLSGAPVGLIVDWRSRFFAVIVCNWQIQIRIDRLKKG